MKLLMNARLSSNKSLCSASIVGSLLLVMSQNACADLTALLGQFTTEKERESARASQAVYDQLSVAGCSDLQIGPTSTCGGTRYLVWRNVREVVHNANALTPNNVGSILFSLGRPNVTLLGRALQWCNGEELASLTSMSTRFVGAQANSLSARIAALRLGAGGFRSARNNRQRDDQDRAPLSDDQMLAGMSAGPISPMRIGAASADDYDDEDTDWSTVGGFITASSMRSEKLATSQENEFDVDGLTVNAGIDKRIGSRWVLGTVFGYQQSNLDFATIATVEAYSDLRAFSVTPYLLYQSDIWFLSFSVGYQDMLFDTHRRVNYASGALATTPVSHNTFANSESHARSWSSNDVLGFSIRPTAKWVIEPSLGIDYQRVQIGKYTEVDQNNQAFNFTVAEQTIESLEAVPALRMQYTFTPRFGVLVPYIDAQWHHQFKTESRDIEALYAGAQSSLSGAANFVLQTDALDEWYQIYTAGFSAVIRGSSDEDGQSAGGMQIYANYRRYDGIRNYSQDVISAGFRYEF